MTPPPTTRGRRRGAHRIGRCARTLLVVLGTLLLVPVVPLAAAQNAPKFLALTIDSVSPNLVTAQSDPIVTVTASVANVGDRAVSDVSVRMQRAQPVSTASELRTTLKLDQQNFDIVGSFVTVADKLDKGQRKTFSLTLPLRGANAKERSLEIGQPGVYPMLLNVNGTPDYGSEARLDDARFLLPVLGVPANPALPQEDPASRAVPAPTQTPLAVTLLWPLADRPRLAAGQPGSLDQKVRLVDDDLARSLARGGRLDALLSAYEFATGPNVDRDRKFTDASCLAVDPDLLVTVSNMRRGYLVVDSDGRTRDGSGAAAATEWLSRLQTLAARVCTFALPFAQVDLPALRSPQLRRSAVVAPADVIDNVLAAQTKRGVVWPEPGTIDDDTAIWLRKTGANTVLLARNGVAPAFDGVAATPDIVQIADAVPDTPGAALRAVSFDVYAATALAAVGQHPQTPSFTPARARYELSRDSRSARLQDALGALVWPTLQTQPDQPRSILLAPPQQWSADGTEAASLLSAVSTLLRAGLAVPRPLDDLLQRAPDPRPFEVSYPQQAVEDATPDSIRNAAADQEARIDQLSGSLVNDPQAALSGERFLAPLREDILRTLTMSGRRTDTGAAESVAAHRITQLRTGIDDLFRAVTVLSPGGVYTLASEQSPLPLAARNDLPVAINVRLRMDAPPEMKLTDIGVQQLPPRGSRALQVPAQVSDSRNLRVTIALTTLDGQSLGDTATVSVRSNAYGTPLLIITGCAGALLLVLAGRRLWHRFRGQPDPADL